MDESNNRLLWDLLRDHVGHNVTIAVYGNPLNPSDVCLECEDCNQVILDAEIYTLSARDDVYETNIL